MEPEHPPTKIGPFVALAVVAGLSLVPFLGSSSQGWIEPHSFAWALLAKTFVVAVALSSIVWLDQQSSDPTRLGHLLTLVLLGMLTAGCHWVMVDRHPGPEKWQRDIYLGILRLVDRPPSEFIPHNFRPAPYGFVRSLEWITGDWHCSSFVYRAYFRFWFVWGSYKFACRYVAPRAALWGLAPLALYYPLSIARYLGQLTDPMSHALFVLALLAVVENRTLWLAALLVVGMFAKETAVLLVPIYFLLYWRDWPRSWIVTFGLGLICTVAFVSTRLPLGWQPGGSLNNVPGTLLLWENLGLADHGAWTSVSLFERYLHPLLYLIPAGVLLAGWWKRIPARLRMISIGSTILVVGIHVAMSWSYESRNFLPMFPILGTLSALAVFGPSSIRE